VSSPYFFVRHTWIQRVDVEKLAKDLGSSFEVVSLDRAESGPTSIVGRETRETFLVKGDTLRVYLSPIKATFFQKERNRITRRYCQGSGSESALKLSNLSWRVV